VKLLLLSLILLASAIPAPVTPSTGQYTPPGGVGGGPAPTIPATTAETPDATRWSRSYAHAQILSNWRQYGFHSPANARWWLRKAEQGL